MLIFILILLGNFGISWWNAHATGKIWSETKALGGFMRIVAWAAAIQACCGFFMFFAAMAAILLLALGVLTAGAFSATLSAMYLMVILPVIGTGLIITIESWIIAYRRRDLASMSEAAWNSFAMAFNSYEALDGGIISAVNVIEDFFEKDDDDPLIFIIGLVVILLAFAAGIGLTAWIMNSSKNSLPLPDRAISTS